MTEYGPTFTWFAWRPTHTEDRGWRWLIRVYKRREWPSDSIMGNTGPYFRTAVVRVALGPRA